MTFDEAIKKAKEMAKGKIVALELTLHGLWMCSWVPEIAGDDQWEFIGELIEKGHHCIIVTSLNPEECGLHPR